MGGIELLAESIGEELRRRLPGQRKTQREALALLVATMLDVRSANLMELAAALPRTAERIDMRYQWVARVLANPLIDCDVVMAPFAREVLARAARLGRVELILDQSKLSDRHQVLMLALRFGERALPLAWRVEQTAGPIGLAQQRALLDLLAAWLPVAGAEVVVLGGPVLRHAWADRGLRRAGLGLPPAAEEQPARLCSWSGGICQGRRHRAAATLPERRGTDGSRTRAHQHRRHP